MTRRAAAVYVVIATLGAARVAADPAPAPPEPDVKAPAFAHLADPSTLTTKTGNVFALPPGYWTDEPTYKLRDDEFKRLQDAETRLGAENKSLRDSTSGWQPGWKTLGLALASGIALGFYLDHKL